MEQWYGGGRQKAGRFGAIYYKVVEDLISSKEHPIKIAHFSVSKEDSQSTKLRILQLLKQINHYAMVCDVSTDKIKLSNGSELHFGYGDAYDNFKGNTYSAVWVDEVEEDECENYNI